MSIAIFGLGYVGFTSMCCLASEGHKIVGFDINESKVNDINSGVCPISEPGVDQLLKSALMERRISAYTAIDGRLDNCDYAIVCVGTPSAPSGEHDMSHIASVSKQIAGELRSSRTSPLTVIYRSTIRPGTMSELIIPIFQNTLGDAFSANVELIYNPEFLRESSAISDYFAPPKIVIGTSNGQSSSRMHKLYNKIEAKWFVVPFAEAELTKFIDNSWHAVKVSFANEIGRICLQLGISVSTMHEIFVSDTKLNISANYTRPGGAFGGSCLPKDVRALQHLSSDCGANTPLIDSLLHSNEAHKFRIYELVSKGLKQNATILVVGIAFKAATDDLRESPAVDLVRNLLRDGFNVKVFDPIVNVDKLQGANLGYAWSQLPDLSRLLISKENAESTVFDCVVATNRTIRALNILDSQKIIMIDRFQ